MGKKDDVKKQDDVLETSEEAENEKLAEEKKELSEEEKLNLRIYELEEEVKFLKNEYLKEKADLENTKKRLEKERIIERKYAAMPVVKSFISPLDHFELAIKHASENESFKQYVAGFEMILKEIKKNLEDLGVTEIVALGEEYNPNFHQAVMKEKIEGKEANLVIEVMQKGYMFKDRVIRPAMVKISE